MSKYTVNMADQLNKIRMDAQEKLRKEAEVVVEPAKPSLLQQSTADYLSKKEEPHPLSPVQNLNEGKMSQLHLYIKQGKTAKEIAKLMGVDAKTIQKLMAAYESRDAKEEDMQEHKGTTPHKHPHEDESLDEREKTVRQLINPNKEVMIVKKNKVVVIDKKDQDKYIKQGWSLAEEVELDEAMDKKTAIAILKIKKKEDFYGRDGAMIYMSPNEQDTLEKKVGRISKRDVPGPSKGVSTMIIINTALGSRDGKGDYDTEGKKMISWKKGGKPIGTPRTIGDAMKLAGIREENEAKLIDKPTGEVLKTGSKEKMETEKKRNRDELQVKEWFKSKNIDVKVRELNESTQVYVPLGRRIPNEIREELITTQYGKMPEDVKNVKDINYGNFMENSITMNNDFWSKVLHGTKGE